MDPVIGIDLGTTNSCVAILEGDIPRVIPNRGGYKTTPSVVAVTQADKRLAGQIAKRQALTNAKNTIYGVKRLIGRSWSSEQVDRTRDNVSFVIKRGPKDDILVEMRNKDYSVQDISAMVLQEMKITAEDYLGQPVTRAVVTVPAYFNDRQRQATRDAGKLAGLDVIRIINEPTAAALAFGHSKHVNKTIAVYDLGGGTFDISILELTDQGVFRVLSTTGDTFLGGEDFDAAVIQWLASEFLEVHGIDLREDRMALQRLRDAAERAKCELSSLSQVDINLPFIISNVDSEALHLQCTLTRRTFETLVQPLVDRTLETCLDALQEAEIELGDIDNVLLVGGMTRVPMIQRHVTELFGKPPNRSVHPDEVVALGACIQGAALVNNEREIVLLDVTPHSLGIMTHGEIFEPLIPRNTTLPTQRKKLFTTGSDDQSRVRILVLQGDERKLDAKDQLTEFTLANLPKRPKGQLEIEVTFDINTDGLLNVSAKELDSGQEETVQVVMTGGNPNQDSARLIDSARNFLIERHSDENRESERQRAEVLIADLEDKLTKVELLDNAHISIDDREEALIAIEEAKLALETPDFSFDHHLGELKSFNDAFKRSASDFCDA